MRRRCSRPSSSPPAISTKSPATPPTSRSARTRRSYSERLRSMTASLPQLRDLWIIGTDGYPLVSGTVFPMPRIDLSDRNYFKVHHDNAVNGPYVTEVLDARAANTQFLRDQPQARNQRPVRRRHHRFDRAGVFQRVLFPASAARDRDAAARRRRGAGALSGIGRRAATPAGQFAVLQGCRHQPGRPGWSRRRPRSTAASASSCTSDWRSCPISTLRSASKPTP